VAPCFFVRFWAPLGATRFFCDDLRNRRAQALCPACRYCDTLSFFLRPAEAQPERNSVAEMPRMVYG
jgi:hypothetical protein